MGGSRRALLAGGGGGRWVASGRSGLLADADADADADGGGGAGAKELSPSDAGHLAAVLPVLRN